LPFPLNPYQIRMRKRGPQACVAYAVAVSTARGASRPTAVWQLPERALMPGREYASDSSLADSETERRNLSSGSDGQGPAACIRKAATRQACHLPVLLRRLIEPQLMKPAEQWLVYICNFVCLRTRPANLKWLEICLM
jgi:hypothetical protein